MSDEKKEKPKEASKNGYSEEEVRKESSKAAKQASEAQNKATELMQAAAAAGDPDERQKLMEEALEHQIQSKSLGKTAKYLRSGTFQGMAVGAGLGIAPGASLGAITGTLVGGVSSTALGGLGAGLGAATGWMHGPFWDMGKGGGKIIQKITGNLPGWEATESQKKQLEKMIGQISEQDAPGQEELESLENEGPSEDQKQAMDDVKAKMPSLPSQISSSEPKEGESEEPGRDEGSGEQSKTKASAESETQSEEQETKKETDGAQEDRERKKKSEADSGQNSYQDVAVPSGEGRKKPRKLQPKAESDAEKPAVTKKQPRKLEKRSE